MPLADMPQAKLANTMDAMLQVFLNDDLSEHSFQLVDGEWHDLLE